MELFLQHLINGFAIGAVYSIFAIGFTLMYSVLGILNLAHAAVFTWGAFAGLFIASSFNLPPYFAMPLAMGLSGLLAVSIDYLVLRPLRARRADPLAPLITTFGAMVVLTSIAQMITDTQTLRYPPDFLPSRMFQLGWLQITEIQVIMIISSVILTIGLNFFLRRTKFGKAVRAVAVSEQVSLLLGIPVNRVIALTNFIAGALGGAAGVLIGVAFNAVTYSMGENYMLKGITAIVIGGFGSVPGAMIGSLFIGILESLTVAYGGGHFRDAIIFILLVATLIVRPQGFLGQDGVGQRS